MNLDFIINELKGEIKMKRSFKKITSLLMTVIIIASLSVTVAAEGDIEVGKLKYFVNGTQVLSLSEIKAGDVVNSEVKVSGTGDACLISVVYDADGLDTVDVSDASLTKSSKVLKTSITLPNDYGNGWKYKCFIWDSITGSLKPYNEAEFEFSLKATVDLESVKLTWDAVDGYMGEPLDIYRDGVKIAIAQAGQGLYIDYFAKADSYAEATYYVANSAGTRVSNTVTATPITAKSILDRSGYIFYNQLGEDGNPIQRAISKTPDSATYYDGTTDASKVADTGKYIRGYACTGDNNIINVVNDTAYPRTNTIQDTVFTDVPTQTNLTNDNSNYIIKNRNYARITKSDGSISSLNNINHSSPYFVYKFKRDNITFTPNTPPEGTNYDNISDFVLYVEYWNTGNQKFCVTYSIKPESTDTNGELGGTDYISSDIYTTLPTKTSANGNWSIAEFTLKNMTTWGKTYIDSTTSNFGINFRMPDSSKPEVAIRSFVLVPKEVADTISDPSRLFTTSNENYTGEVASFSVNGGTITQSNMVVNQTGGDGEVVKENDYVTIAPYANGSTGTGYRVRLNIDDSFLYTTGTSGVQVEVTYTSNYYTYLPVKYLNSAGSEQRQNLLLVNDGQKHTSVIEINDIALMNTLFGNEKRDIVLDMVSNREGNRSEADYSNRYLHIHEFKLRKPIDRNMMDLSK